MPVVACDLFSLQSSTTNNSANTVTIASFTVSLNKCSKNKNCQQSVQYITNTTTPDFNNTAFILDATADTFTFTLPDCTSKDGINYQIKRTDSTAHTLTIQGYNSSQTIDG